MPQILPLGHSDKRRSRKLAKASSFFNEHVYAFNCSERRTGSKIDEGIYPRERNGERLLNDIISNGIGTLNFINVNPSTNIRPCTIQVIPLR